MPSAFRRAAAGCLVAVLCCTPVAAGQEAPVDAPPPAGTAAPAAGTTPAAAPTPAGRVGAASLESLARHDDAPIARVGEVELHRSDAFRILDLATPARSAEQKIALALITHLRLADIAGLSSRSEDGRRGELDRLLDNVMVELPHLSDLIARSYFSHAAATHTIGTQPIEMASP